MSTNMRLTAAYKHFVLFNLVEQFIDLYPLVILLAKAARKSQVLCNLGDGVQELIKNQLSNKQSGSSYMCW